MFCCCSSCPHIYYILIHTTCWYFISEQKVEGSQLDFMDYGPEEMAALVRLATEERGFMLHKDLTPAKLLELLKVSELVS